MRASGLQRGHLFSRVINEEEENSGWQHLLRLNDEIKNPGRAIYARAVFSRRISRKKKTSFKDFLLWINICRQSLKILGIVKLTIPFLCIYICWFQIKVVI